jgi:hypothetical protein
MKTIGGKDSIPMWDNALPFIRNYADLYQCTERKGLIIIPLSGEGTVSEPQMIRK